MFSWIFNLQSQNRFDLISPIEPEESKNNEKWKQLAGENVEPRLTKTKEEDIDISPGYTNEYEQPWPPDVGGR